MKQTFYLLLAMVLMASCTRTMHVEQTFVEAKTNGKYPPFFFPASLSLNKSLEAADMWQVLFNKANVQSYNLQYLRPGDASSYPVIDANGNTTNTQCDWYNLTINYTNGSIEQFTVFCKRGTASGVIAPPATAVLNIPGPVKKVKLTKTNDLQPYYNILRLKPQSRSKYIVEVDGVVVSNDYLNGTISPAFWFAHKF